jgi:OmpA-OmpF porin, OOP family
LFDSLRLLKEIEMLRKVMSCSLVFGLLQLAAVSAAAESGFYLGLAAGVSNTNFEKAPLDAAVAAAYAPSQVLGTSNLDTSAKSYGPFGGYSFNDYLAFEAAYMKLAVANYDLLGGNPMNFFSAWRSWESEGFTVAVVGKLPIGKRFDVHARTGIYFADTKFDQRMVVSTAGSDTSEEFLFGLGIGFRIYDNLSAILDFARYADVGTEVTQETDVDTATLSLAYYF